MTGGTGFIGYHVVRALLAAGHQVRVLVRSPERAGRLAGLDVQLVWGDLRTGEGLAEAVDGCEAVFHVAALYSLDRRDRVAMYETNVEGTRRLLAAARSAGVRRFIHTSSTATVGLRPDGLPADETTPLDLSRVQVDYKRSKVLAEQAALQACASGLDVVVVNPSTPVGWGDVRPTPTGRIILDFLRGRMPAYVDTGLNVVDVEDVAAGHLLAWEKGRTGERYILGHENLTLAELLRRVAALAGLRPPRFRMPFTMAVGLAVVDEFVASPLLGRPPRVPLAGVRLARQAMYYTPAKAVRELGLPQTPVDRALERAIAWFRQGGYWEH